MKSLEKRQENVLQGHNSTLFSVGVTSDNKYIDFNSAERQ